MQPWAEVSNDNRRVLRQPGKQMLVYLSNAAELDLSAESGLFHVNIINPRTGTATSGDQVKAGGKVKLPEATVIWLTKE
ncbi:MAG: hypothetical protein QM813_13895 [Verrucomicrobiota bacterium]